MSALALVATGATTALSGGTAGIVTAVGGGLIGKVEGLFSGGSRDAQRQQRVAALVGAANAAGPFGAGSVRAGQIVLAGPDNVAGDEQGYWRTGWGQINPAIQAAAVAAGKEWPTGQPFDMPNERAVIQAQLAQIGSTYVMPSLGGTAVASPMNAVLQPIQTAIGNAVQTVGAGLANAGATAVNPNGNYRTVPTSMNTILLVVLGAVVVLGLARHHAE